MTNAQNRERQKPALPVGVTGPSLQWRLFASSWLLLLLVGGGGMAWLAFGLIAAIGRRTVWWIFAGVYAVAAFVAWIPDEPVGDIARGSLYLVILVHGLIVNQTWLTLLWSRNENGLTILGTPPGGNRRRSAPAGPRQRAAVPKEAEELLGTSGTSRSDYLDDSAASAPAPRRRRWWSRTEPRGQETPTPAVATTRTAAARTPARTATAPTGPAELVDVNTANQRTIARLTGMDRGRAKAVIAQRSKRGGFSSLEDFAATADLQPHQIVRLRDEAFCSPRPRAQRTFGRRVDY